MTRISDSGNSLSSCVIGSSSAGNATVIWNSNSAVLVDCGFNPTYLSEGLESLNLRISDLKGVLITHGHGDHVHESAIKRFIKERVSIYFPSQIEPYLKARYGTLRLAAREGLLSPIKKNEAVIDGFSIRPFEVPHDSDGGCFGYSIIAESAGSIKKVSVVTDIAYPTNSVIRHLANSDIIVLESNYDEQMLRNSSRPLWLKQRIEAQGHLSNHQCADIVLQVIDHSKTLPTHIALAHISQQCNTNELALECTGQALEQSDYDDLRLYETHPDRPGQAMMAS